MTSGLASDGEIDGQTGEGGEGKGRGEVCIRLWLVGSAVEWHMRGGGEMGFWGSV